MTDRHRSGLFLSIVIVAALSPLLADRHSGAPDEAWPALLAVEPANVDPDYARLQERANAALEKVLRSDGASP
jgi:hypothetical protein